MPATAASQDDDDAGTTDWLPDWPIQREPTAVDDDDGLPIGTTLQAASGSDIHVPRSVHTTAASKAALVLLPGQLLLPNDSNKTSTNVLGTIEGLGGGCPATLRLGSSVKMTGKAVPTTNRFMVVSIGANKKVTVKAVLSKVWVFGDVQSKDIRKEGKQPLPQSVSHRGASERASSGKMSRKQALVDESDGSDDDDRKAQSVAPMRKQPPRSASKPLPPRNEEISSCEDDDIVSTNEIEEGTRKRSRNGASRSTRAKSSLKRQRLQEHSDDESPHASESEQKPSSKDMGRETSQHESSSEVLEPSETITKAEEQRKHGPIKLLDSSDGSNTDKGVEETDQSTKSVLQPDVDNRSDTRSVSDMSDDDERKRATKATAHKETENKVRSTSTTTESSTRKKRSDNFVMNAKASEHDRPMSRSLRQSSRVTPRQHANHEQSKCRKLDSDLDESPSEEPGTQSPEAGDDGESSETCSESEIHAAFRVAKNTKRSSDRFEKESVVKKSRPKGYKGKTVSPKMKNRPKSSKQAAADDLYDEGVLSTTKREHKKDDFSPSNSKLPEQKAAMSRDGDRSREGKTHRKSIASKDKEPFTAEKKIASKGASVRHGEAQPAEDSLGRGTDRQKTNATFKPATTKPKVEGNAEKSPKFAPSTDSPRSKSKRPSPTKRRRTPETLRKRLWKASTEFTFSEE